MALGTYAQLQAAIADWLHRDDLTTKIPDFISLAEADMQVRAKLSQWDTSASVSLTSGSGPLPSDFAQAISVTYSNDSYTISYMPPEQFDNLLAANGAGTPEFYTIRGSTLQVTPTATGTATLRYTARFTPLSDAATTNSLLTLFPDAYLYGSLMHSAIWSQDEQNMARYAGIFGGTIDRIRTYMNQYKYPHGLQMRVA